MTQNDAISFLSIFFIYFFSQITATVTRDKRTDLYSIVEGNPFHRVLTGFFFITKKGIIIMNNLFHRHEIALSVNYCDTGIVKLKIPTPIIIWFN